MPIVAGRVSDDRLAAMASAARGRPFSYPEVGATKGAFPSGYRIERRAVDLGDAARFGRAVDGLRRWQVQRGAGARVAPADASVVPDETVLVALSFVVVTIVATCRIVYVTDEPDRFGFAYGTVTGHPEQGEESFHVVREGEMVRFEIASFSRPVHPLARMGLPVTHLLQERVTRRYLAALETFVRQA